MLLNSFGVDANIFLDLLIEWLDEFASSFKKSPFPMENELYTCIITIHLTLFSSLCISKKVSDRGCYLHP